MVKDKLLTLILRSKVLIALGAVAQALLTYRMFYLHPQIDTLILVFGLTLLAYHFHHVVSFSNHWIFGVILFLWVLLLWRLWRDFDVLSQSIVLAIGIVVVLYNFGFRNIYGLKIFIIAFSWSMLCIGLPLASQYWLWMATSHKILIYFLQKFLFMIAITIPFDICDMEEDKQNGLHTLPLILGDKATHYLTYALLIICSILAIEAEGWTLRVIIKTTFFLSISFTALYYARGKSIGWYYYGIIDGLLIWQAINYELWR